MRNFVEHPPNQGSQRASVRERHVGLDTGAREPEKDSYEWYLVRCQNPALFHLIEVGESMRAIRDRELYRPEYSTWDDFCQEKLKISTEQAGIRIQCADVASELNAADCVNLPFNESQCRPLLRLEPGFLRVYAWELTCTLTPVGKSPSSGDVMRAVRLLELWPAPINEEKRGYFDFRKLLYQSRLSISLAEGIFKSSQFQHWLKDDASTVERNVLRHLLEELVGQLHRLNVGDDTEGHKGH